MRVAMWEDTQKDARDFCLGRTFLVTESQIYEADYREFHLSVHWTEIGVP